MSKYKYYFKKPTGEIGKDILKSLALAGAVCIAGTSPYFAVNLFKTIKGHKKKKICDTFYNLKRYGYINFEKKNHQLYISLTDHGKKAAGRFQIDNLEIRKPKKWDKKWRLVIFDIAHLKRIKRELFRGKLKELDFYPLQKSVWVYPYKCNDEIELLRDFFGLSKKEVCLIVADFIENSGFLRKVFKLH